MSCLPHLIRFDFGRICCCCCCSLTSYWRTSSFDLLSSSDPSFAPLLYVSSSFPLSERLFPLFLTFSLTLTLVFSFPDGLTNPMALTSTSKQVTLEFLSPAWPHTTTSDPYVQQPTRHLHRMTHTHLKFTVPKPLLPPKTCLDPIRENIISSHSCLDLWSSHTFHGLNIT